MPHTDTHFLYTVAWVHGLGHVFFGFGHHARAAAWLAAQ